jgi:hypothetical protein
MEGRDLTMQIEFFANCKMYYYTENEEEIMLD